MALNENGLRLSEPEDEPELDEAGDPIEEEDNSDDDDDDEDNN
ncbi:MAG: hypothetical protein WD512_02590 [Candidatus Paceibacterota bacterium]